METKDRPFEFKTVYNIHVTVGAKEFEKMQPRSAGLFGGLGMRPAPAPSAKDSAEDSAGKPDSPTKLEEVHRNTFGQNLAWVKGNISIDGQAIDDVGLRYKGNGTIMDSAKSIKKSFKIDLARYDGKERFQGSKTINLHSGAADPSKCRETFGYAIYREAGVPAPRTALAEVYLTVPGKYEKELLGIYTVVEQVGSDFLERHYKHGAGLLMKPEGLREIDYRGDDWNRYVKNYEPNREATAEESKRVIEFAKLVHKADDAEFQKQIGSFLDIDGYLRFLATTAFVANTDSFFMLGHNYYLYLNTKTGLFHFFPWDLDRSLANFPFTSTHEQQMNFNIAHPYGGTHRLTDRVMALPDVAEKYDKLYRELAAKPFSKESLLRQLDEIETATKELVARDAKAASARKETASGGPFSMAKPPALKVFIEKRTESVAAQLAGKSKGFTPSGGFGFGGARPKVSDQLAAPLLTAADGDKSGKLSKSEWLAMANKIFTAAKKDSEMLADGRSLADAISGMLAKPAVEGPMDPNARAANFLATSILKRADANQDGKLSQEELTAAAEKVFDEFDKRKAGELEANGLAELIDALFIMPRFGGMGAPARP